MTNNLKILYHIPNPSGTGADRWIYEGWRDSFEDLDHKVYSLTFFDDFHNKVEQVRPDIFMTAINLIDFNKDFNVLRKMRSMGVKIFMWVHWPLAQSCESAFPYIMNENIADVYFGEREPSGMADFEVATGKTYHTIANAANKKLHFPSLEFAQKYAYDIVYLGAKLPLKNWFFDNVLLPLKKEYNVGIFGPYWTIKDNILRTGAKICSSLRLETTMAALNKRRIVIPPDEENLLYSSAKICLNFHEREADGSQPHYIVNQRTFKIPACGGFQICDDIPAIRKYFTEDELVMAKTDKNDWLDKIRYYLSHNEERKAIQRRGVARALKDHTYHNRIDDIIRLYKNL